MIKNKSLFKNLSIFFCLVPMLLLSFLCLVPFNNFNGVYAAGDTTETTAVFTGSNVINSFMGYNNGSISSFTNLTSYDLNANYSHSIKLSYIHTDTPNLTFYYQGYSNANSWSGSSNPAYSDNPSYFTLGTYTNLSSNFTINKTIYCRYSNGGPVWYSVVGFSYMKGNDLPTLQMKSLEIGNYNDGFARSYFAGNNNILNGYYNYISYVDTNDNRYSFAFPLSYQNWIREDFNNLSSAFYYEHRSYLFITDLSNNDYYNAGYDDGYSVGNSDGNSTGYQDGYTAGETVGYGNGYNDGLEQSNNYSFLSLIGSVIDAPVSAFTSLLNFNLLGFNMLGFVTGLLTLSLIIFIVKLILGGK